MAEGERGRNGVPVLERTMDLLGLLERSEAGHTIRELTLELGLPRSTVYRILNTLQAHGMVGRTTGGAYLLGTRLLALAARVRPSRAAYDLPELALPFMQRLTEQTGEPCKISVRDGNLALVTAAVLGPHEYSPTPASGTSFPLHAGAASKLILAHLPAAELDDFLARPLERYTPRTITDPGKLRAELGRIRRQGYARDQGEHGASVHAIAAPIFEGDGRFLAALSIPFLGDKDVPTRDKLRDAVVRMAAVISAAIPAPIPAS
ncbi:MAG TPA: IclR family transcriptional regulator [Devosia sp.]|nr:IclR family transcriptional regulator [Devosia sp.]